MSFLELYPDSNRAYLTDKEVDNLQWALNFMQKYESKNKINRLIEKDLLDE